MVWQHPVNARDPVRYTPEQKEKTRRRILAAAERSFKRGGYSGVGVDGLAKEAGVTSGAFYGHFPSKQAAFEEAVVAGLGSLYAAIARYQREAGEDWWRAFAEFYTGEKRNCDLAESCALQSLTPEVARADPAVRARFENELRRIVQLASEGDDRQARQRTWARLAMLVGGVSLARAVQDESLADEIAAAIRDAVTALGER